MAMSKGCTIALIVVAVLAAIIIIGGVLVWLNKDKIMQAGIDQMVGMAEVEIKASLPEGYSEESVTELMGELKAALNENKIAADKIQGLAANLREAMADKHFDVEESKDMLNLIEDALGKEPSVMNDMGEEEMPGDSLAVPDSL
ncbi:MAG: hypothetical protein ABIE07_12315 [Candidatus Zixiibacteriota bacterium]